jgi:exonuclease SbcC
VRPLTLRVSGFTCFRDDQPALDFTNLELFAITGPTGSGKSTVLDAITYALYGRVPRMGKQGVKELISHGRDRLTVMLAFAVGGEHYVVSRSTRRSGSTQCQLDRLHDGQSSPVASGVKPVADAVNRLVGLDYDAFTQAVLLPQGEFARFLKGAAADRRRILQDLLRLTMYTRMREIAGQRHATARARVAALGQQLESLAVATPAALAALEDERHALVASLDTLRQAVTDDRTRREAIAARVRLARERTELAAQLVALQASAPQQAARHRQLHLASAARLVVPLLDVWDRADEAFQARQREERSARATARDARVRAEQAARLRDAATTAAAAIPVLRERIAALERLEGRLAQHAALERDWRRWHDDLEDATALATAEERKARAARQAHEDAEVLHQSALEALGRIVLDEGELAVCERGRDRAIELRRDRLEATAIERRQARATRALDDARQIHQAREDAATAAQVAHQRAVVERDDAWRHQQALWDQHRAMTLRAHLAPGHACPVCEQHVAVVPPVRPAPDQKEADVAVDETAESVQLATIVVRQAQDALSRAAASLEGAQADVARVAVEAAGLAARIHRSETALRSELSRYLPASASSRPEDWLLERVEEVRGDRARADAAARAAQVAREVAAGAAVTLTLADEAHAARLREVQRLGVRLEACETDRLAVAAVIAQVTTAADPQAELASLASEVTRLEWEAASSRDVATREEMALVVASARLDESRRGANDARATRDRSEAEAQRSAAEHGFASPAEARAAWLSDAAYATAAAERDEWDGTQARLAARLDELAADLGPHPAGPDVLVAADAACRASDEALGRALGRRGELDAQVTALRQRVGEAAAVRDRLSAGRADLDVHGVLTADLQANAFQDWLLAEVFERLVQGASARLMELSNRYTLLWIDQEFYVVDHDNAGERRTADTLSGGETFLASLALALELSEQVQRAAGAVHLDSLFIDEGFGSLDSDAQDVVAAAIESLQMRGRMVGIITHVRELTDRMPASVVIDKRADGSRWSVRAAGV